MEPEPAPCSWVLEARQLAEDRFLVNYMGEVCLLDQEELVRRWEDFVRRNQ